MTTSTATRRISIIELMTEASEAARMRAERIAAEVPVLTGAGQTQMKRIALLKNRTDEVAKAELLRADSEREAYIARNNKLEADLTQCGEIIDAIRDEMSKAREPGWRLTFGSTVEIGLRDYLRELQAAPTEHTNAPFPHAARKQLEHRRASIHALIGLLTRKDSK